MDTNFPAELDKFLATLARLFADKGASAEVAVLTLGRPTCEYLGEHYTGDPYKLEVPQSLDNHYEIMLEVPQSLYNQVADRKRAVEGSLRDESEQLMGRYPDVSPPWLLHHAVRCPRTPSGATRLGVGFPARQCPTRAECVRTMLHRIRWTDFCSDQSRRFIFTAPSRPANFSFAPLPVFVRGGELRHRVEPDFVIFYRNQVLVLELDGKQFHPETPAEADARLALLKREGAYVEHISSAECDTAEKAETIAKQIFALLEKLAANK